jgi:hypothetical protein
VQITLPVAAWPDWRAPAEAAMTAALQEAAAGA